MKLTDIQCKKAKPEEKQYKLFDGGGLFLLVKPNGSKLWRMKYYFNGKEKLLSIGAYPVVTLGEARDYRANAKKLLAQFPPQDPSEVKKDVKREAILNAENTFKAVALEWHEVNSQRWSKNYSNKVLKGLELNVFPFIGKRPINDITPPELLEKCLRQIEKRGSLDIAGRTKQICGQIFRYGIQTGKCERDASADLKGALKTHTPEHFRTIEAKQLPDFINALERNEARLFERTRRAVWLSLYTFLRPQEIRMARIQDIDLESKTWIVPKQIMKKRREHIVPLSNQAIEVIKAQLKEIEVLNTEWLFPSQPKPRNPMSDGTVNKAIKRLGFGGDMVAHGFRALARTTLSENLKCNPEVIEKQLAHKTKNPLGEAYDRTQYLDERREMMQIWADYLGNISNG